MPISTDPTSHVHFASTPTDGIRYDIGSGPTVK
jgi:hypothetical protein